MKIGGRHFAISTEVLRIASVKDLLYKVKEHCYW